MAKKVDSNIPGILICYLYLIFCVFLIEVQRKHFIEHQTRYHIFQKNDLLNVIFLL